MAVILTGKYLTGRIRFRRGWFGKLILQIEYRGDMYAEEGFAQNDSTCWRDASITDLTETLWGVSDVNQA